MENEGIQRHGKQNEEENGAKGGNRLSQRCANEGKGSRKCRTAEGTERTEDANDEMVSQLASFPGAGRSTGSNRNSKTSRGVDKNVLRVLRTNQTRWGSSIRTCLLSQEISRKWLLGITSFRSLSILGSTRRCINPRRTLANEEKFRRYRDRLQNI
jgi:hypothetical protein